MCVVCLNVCRLCMPNIMSLGVCFKKLHIIKVGAFVLDTASKLGVRLERRKVDKKANLHENWSVQTRVFETQCIMHSNLICPHVPCLWDCPQAVRLPLLLSVARVLFLELYSNCMRFIQVHWSIPYTLPLIFAHTSWRYVPQSALLRLLESWHSFKSRPRMVLKSKKLQWRTKTKLWYNSKFYELKAKKVVVKTTKMIFSVYIENDIVCLSWRNFARCDTVPGPGVPMPSRPKRTIYTVNLKHWRLNLRGLWFKHNT